MKKLLITVLFFSLVLGGVYGAGKKDEPAKTAGAAAMSAAAGTHTVVDFKGNSVEVPNKIERIVVLGPLPAPTVLTVFQQGKTDNIVGVSPDSVNGAKYSIFSKYAPDFQNISSAFYTGGKLNLETDKAQAGCCLLYGCIGCRTAPASRDCCCSLSTSEYRMGCKPACNPQVMDGYDGSNAANGKPCSTDYCLRRTS